MLKNLNLGGILSGVAVEVGDEIVKELHYILVKWLIRRGLWSVTSGTSYKKEAVALMTQCSSKKIKNKNKGQQTLSFGQT